MQKFHHCVIEKTTKKSNNLGNELILNQEGRHVEIRQGLKESRDEQGGGPQSRKTDSETQRQIERDIDTERGLRTDAVSFVTSTKR